MSYLKPILLLLCAIQILIVNPCCSLKSVSQPPDVTKDIVMKEGMSIAINNPNCFSLTITAGKGLERHYTWNNATRSTTLLPRKTKWYGTYGAYSPGRGHHWQMHDGITRLLADEAVVNYQSKEELLCAIANENDKCRNKLRPIITAKTLKNFDFENTLPLALSPGNCSAFTDSGLYVSVKKAKGPGQGGTLYVIIHQITLNGKPVKSLPGSSNNRIKVQVR